MRKQIVLLAPDFDLFEGLSVWGRQNIPRKRHSDSSHKPRFSPDWEPIQSRP